MNPEEIHTLSIKAWVTAVEKMMLNQNGAPFFNICAVDSALTRIYPQFKECERHCTVERGLLSSLHCLRWEDMSPELTSECWRLVRRVLAPWFDHVPGPDLQQSLNEQDTPKEATDNDAS